MDERDLQRRVAQYRLERLEAQDRVDGPPDPGPDGTPHVPADGGAEPTDGRGPAVVDPTTDGRGPAVVNPTTDGRGPAVVNPTTDGRGPAVVNPTSGGREPAGAVPRPPTMAARGAFADELVRQAMARGEFDDLPLTGKPIPGLTGRYDPDWWLKSFIEREQITGVLPEALQLRKDDAVLDARLDDEHLESRVREALEEFNARVVAARRQLLGGPPVVTPTRDVEREVARWRERRRAREAAADAERAATDVGRSRTGRWWGGRRRD